METLYLSAAVSLVCLVALLALRLRRKRPEESAIRVLAEQSLGATGLVLVEVDGHRMLLSKSAGGMQLVSELKEAAPAAASPAAVAGAAQVVGAPLDKPEGKRELSGRVAQWMPAVQSDEVEAPAAPAEEMPGFATSSLYNSEDAVADAYEDYLQRRNAESTQPFVFEIRQHAAQP